MDLTDAGVAIAGLKIVGKPFAEVGADLVREAAMPLAKAVGEIAAYPLVEWHNRRKERAVQLLNDAGEILKAEGKEPVAVPGRILGPLLELGSMEDESEDLRRRFARLLASAADPNPRARVLPAFPRVLAELSPLDAKILDKIFEQGLPPYNMPYTVTAKAISQELGAPSDTISVAMQNLTRLKLIEMPISTLRRVGDESNPVNEFTGTFHVTSFGMEFILSCTEINPLARKN